MAEPTFQHLSGSTGGKGIKVGASTTPGTNIHTTGTSASVHDLIDLDCYNSDTVERTLVLEWGGTTAPDDNVKYPVPPGMTISIVRKRPLTGDGAAGRSVKAFCTTINVLVVNGKVTRMA